MNVFSNNAIEELQCFGVKPLSILHVREENTNQPEKPILLEFQMKEARKSNEKLLIFCGDDDSIEDITDNTCHELRTDVCVLHLRKFPWVAP